MKCLAYSSDREAPRDSFLALRTRPKVVLLHETVPPLVFPFNPEATPFYPKPVYEGNATIDHGLVEKRRGEQFEKLDSSFDALMSEISLDRCMFEDCGRPIVAAAVCSCDFVGYSGSDEVAPDEIETRFTLVNFPSNAVEKISTQDDCLEKQRLESL